MGLLPALTVHQTLTLHVAAFQSQHVSATAILSRHKLSASAKLGTLQTIMAHARRAVSTNTKHIWGLLAALIVHSTPFLQLAAPQSQHVSAMTTLSSLSPGVRAKPGILKTKEAYACRAVSINTRQTWGLLIALIVH